MATKMQELIAAGLFNKGLVEITAPTLVGRYNDALTEMGLSKTKLRNFTVDQMGWSAEIAKELDDDYYLAHGPANPFAIVLTPDQAHAPIYFPTHSYDWQLMEMWYRTHRAQVADITRNAALWLDIDQMVANYTEPRDLLMVHEVIVRTHSTSGIIGEAIRQKGMVSRFMQETDAHLDTDLIERIKASSEKVGDLRARNCIIRDQHFTDVTDFYARVVGGVFVLRSHGDVPIIVARDTAWAEKHQVYTTNDDVLNTLIEHRFLECDFVWWKKHITYLEVMAESFLMDVLDQEVPDLDFFSLNSARQKGIVKRYAKRLDDYFEIIRIINAIKHGERPEIHPDVASVLLHPAQRLSPSSREVVEHLLSILRGGRLVQMFYRYQKTTFLDAYTKRWRVPKRTWALKRVREHYDRLERIRLSAA